MIGSVTAVPSVLRIGSRGSTLALAQAAIVADRLRALFPEQVTEIVIVRTEGDVDTVSPLTEIGGRGVFTSALEAAVLRGEIDAAVHSAKDLPTTLHPAAPIVAFLDRDDPRDVLVSRDGLPLDLLPPDPVIGTSSRRRDVQVRRLRPDARPVSIRGNIDSRLRTLERGHHDAILLAAAGLRRLGWEHRITRYFSVEEMVPAPAQGALAVQARSESGVARLLTALNDPSVSVPVGAERAFLAALGAGCSVPAGAFAATHERGMRFRAMLAHADGARIAEADDLLEPGCEAEQAADIGRRLQIEIGLHPDPVQWAGWEVSGPACRRPRVVVTRARTQAQPLLNALARRGAEPIAFPTIRVEALSDTSALDAALRDAAHGRFAWLVFTSVNAVQSVATRLDALGFDSARLANVSVAAVGRTTAAAAARLGLNIVAIPAEATGGALAEELRGRMCAGDRVLYPVSAVGREELPEALRAQGAAVAVIPVYTTAAEADVDDAVLERIRTREFDLVTFSSPSSVRCFAQIVGDEGSARGRAHAVCAGPVTAQAARDAGFEVVAVAADPGAEGMAEAVAAYWRRQQMGRPRACLDAATIAGRSAG